MRWLVVGNITNAAAEALRRHEHVAVLPETIQLSETANPVDVLDAAHKSQLDVMTADHELAEESLKKSSRFARSIVYLQLEGGEVEQDDAIDRLFTRYKRLSPRRLYTVTATRVKVRQLPAF